MTTNCALCNRTARVYCEADMASLCWICDKTVHSANFLAARHRRRLHCRLCNILSPAASSGPVLSSSSFICRFCGLRLPSYKRIRLVSGAVSDEESSCSYSSCIAEDESSPPEQKRRCGRRTGSTAADVRLSKNMDESVEDQQSETTTVA